jgi:hypothetical protein
MDNKKGMEIMVKYSYIKGVATQISKRETVFLSTYWRVL